MYMGNLVVPAVCSAVFQLTLQECGKISNEYEQMMIKTSDKTVKLAGDPKVS